MTIIEDRRVLKKYGGCIVSFVMIVLLIVFCATIITFIQLLPITFDTYTVVNSSLQSIDCFVYIQNFNKRKHDQLQYIDKCNVTLTYSYHENHTCSFYVDNHKLYNVSGVYPIDVNTRTHLCKEDYDWSTEHYFNTWFGFVGMLCCFMYGVVCIYLMCRKRTAQHYHQE